MRRITKAALGGLAGCALAMGGTQVAVSAVAYFLYPDNPEVDQIKLANLPADGPFDRASANLRVKVSPTGANFKLEVSGIVESDPEADNVYGAHLHTYGCDETPPGGGQLGGPHYNHDVYYYGKAFPTTGELPSETVAEVSPQTEVWFTFAPNAHGTATADATVPFTPVDAKDSEGRRNMSIVIHLLPTNTDLNYPNSGPVGSAGGRQACFPIDATNWALDPPTTP